MERDEKYLALMRTKATVMLVRSEALAIATKLIGQLSLSEEEFNKVQAAVDAIGEEIERDSADVVEFNKSMLHYN